MGLDLGEKETCRRSKQRREGTVKRRPQTATVQRTSNQAALQREERDLEGMFPGKYHESRGMSLATLRGGFGASWIFGSEGAVAMETTR